MLCKDENDENDFGFVPFIHHPFNVYL